MTPTWTYVSQISDVIHSTGKDSYNLDTHILSGRFEKSDILGYSGTGMEISWTMQCGNDALQYSSVPEPANMILLGTGLLGLVGIGRKKLFKK
jgi:hypothetical protein